MPKKIEHNFQISHILADGAILSDDEFNKKIFKLEDNIDAIEEFIMCFNKNYKNRNTVKFQRELTKCRREKLQLEIEKIEEELSKIK